MRRNLHLQHKRILNFEFKEIYTIIEGYLKKELYIDIADSKYEPQIEDIKYLLKRIDEYYVLDKCAGLKNKERSIFIELQLATYLCVFSGLHPNQLNEVDISQIVENQMIRCNFTGSNLSLSEYPVELAAKLSQQNGSFFLYINQNNLIDVINITLIMAGIESVFKNLNSMRVLFGRIYYLNTGQFIKSREHLQRLFKVDSNLELLQILKFFN